MSESGSSPEQGTTADEGAAVVEAGHLEVEKLCKSYAGAEGELSVLRDLDLELRGGDGVAITGPSGSGKSTLLHILGGLDHPTSGTVRLDDVAPFTLSEGELAHFRNRTIGFVFQEHHLLPQCDVLENVLLPTLPAGGADAAAVERARELLDAVGLTPRLEHRPAELSGGERQRVALARALINQPRMVLADEPTGNLDRRSAAPVAELLLSLCQERSVILIVVTHSLELAGQMPRCFDLQDGKLVDVGGR